MRGLWVIAPILLFGAGPVMAQPQMDLDAVDPAMLADFLGDWSIQNSDGSKSCKVTLSREETIGGIAIDVDPDCGDTFPVMKHVAGWRLYEDWQSLIRFSTPDNAYVAEPETDGITTIVKIGSGLEN